jgi:hypothetical protein
LIGFRHSHQHHGASFIVVVVVAGMAPRRSVLAFFGWKRGGKFFPEIGSHWTHEGLRTCKKRPRRYLFRRTRLKKKYDSAQDKREAEETAH